MDKKDNKIIVAFILVLIIAIGGICGTLYFYNKSLNSKEGKDNIEYTDITSTDDGFTHLFNLNYEFKPSEPFNVEFKLNNLDVRIEKKSKDEPIYLNNKKVDIKPSSTFQVFNIFITNKMVLFLSLGEAGDIFLAYDLNGNQINLNENIKGGCYGAPEVEYGKLYIETDVCNHLPWVGYKFGNLETTDACPKSIKDYPDVVEKYKDQVLKYATYLDLSNNELSLKKDNDKVLLTVGDLVRQNPNLCVKER